MTTIQRILVCLCVLLPALPGEELPDSGFRSRWEQRGVAVAAAYSGEAFASPGGASLLGSLTASLALDLGRLRLARGQFFLSAQDVHGRGINDRLIGALQPPSNLETPAFHRLTEAWYADSWFDGKARIRVGRQFADRDFGAVASASDFLNAAFGAIPTAPMPTYPQAALGASAWIVPSDRISTGVAVFRGAFRVVETRVEASSRDTAAIGGWTQCADRGLYATVEHRFRAESDQPRAIFARWGRAPAGGQLSSYTGAGFVYGSVGLGVTTVRPSGERLETVYEAYYKLRFRGRLSLQPDLQWIANPSGRCARHWIGGLRFTIEL